MGFLKESYEALKENIDLHSVTLVAVSKTKPVEDILLAYESGLRDFGENYVQELCEKHTSLPKDIRWHFIGHLQTNKVKYIAPFVYLIHGVDSEKVLLEINKQGKKLNKTINCLLQIHIAKEETKFGLNETELEIIIEKYFSQHSSHQLEYVKVCGFMGMASLSKDTEQIKNEFQWLRSLFNKYQQLQTSNFKPAHLSMGMSGDYLLALKMGSNMIRIGSLLFGERKNL
ncbi:MAG: YggS family pyridoxal phosphate-dependent enzyme [Ferruginibacter sp.]|nr:YggS family pyridoxal phosphate-dependent enzyme [Ferruginibacter sp.]